MPAARRQLGHPPAWHRPIPRGHPPEKFIADQDLGLARLVVAVALGVKCCQPWGSSSVV